MSSGRYGKYGEIKRLERARNAGRPIRRGGKEVLSPGRSPKRRPGRGTEFIIRDARLTDAGFIGELSAKAFLVYGSYRDVIRGWFETGLTTTLVAAVRGRPAGFVMAAPLTPQPFPGTEILAIAVEPHSRRLGVGRSLLAGVEKALFQKGCRRLWLHTAVVNQPARRMFEAAGFAPAEAKKAFYPSGHDALLMIKDLSSTAP